MYLLCCTIGWSQALGQFVLKANMQQRFISVCRRGDLSSSSRLSDFQRPCGHMMEPGDGSGAASAEHTDS